MGIELGGFAESPEVIDGDFNAFNYCLAQDYVTALFREDFDAIGEIDIHFFDNICYWINYTKELNNEKLVQKIKKAKIITVKNRSIIDAIYEKKAVYLADIYLHNYIYSPKLILTILLSNNQLNNIFITGENDEEISSKLKELCDFIELEYEKQVNKKEFITKIKNNLNRIKVSKEYRQQPISNNYEWLKAIKKISPKRK